MTQTITSTMKCSECGGEALDPFCIENCRKHLCEKCGAKCFDTSDEDCHGCVYEPEVDVEVYEELSPEAIQEAADEFEDQFFDAGNSEEYDDQAF